MFNSRKTACEKYEEMLANKPEKEKEKCKFEYDGFKSSIFGMPMSSKKCRSETKTDHKKLAIAKKECEEERRSLKF